MPRDDPTTTFDESDVIVGRPTPRRRVSISASDISAVVVVTAALTLAWLLSQPPTYESQPRSTVDVLRASERDLDEFGRGRIASSSVGTGDLSLDVTFSGVDPGAFDRLENLFQTDALDRGVRLEFSPPRTLAVIAPASSGPATGYVLSEDFDYRGAHRVEVEFARGAIRAWLDSAKVVDVAQGNYQIHISAIRAGGGFDPSREFTGRIQALRLSYRPSSTDGKGWRDAAVGTLFVVVVVGSAFGIARTVVVRTARGTASDGHRGAVN